LIGALNEEYSKKFLIKCDNLLDKHRYQAVMYSMLITDNYDVEVNRAFLVYVRSKNKLKEISITEDDFQTAKQILQEIIQIIDKGYYPSATSYKRRCRDCCY